MMNTIKLSLMTIVVTTLFILGACDEKQQNKNKIHETEEVEVRHDHSKMENNQKETGKYAVGDKVPNKQVCMVNDAYMARDQIPVPVNGKTYYGCCQMCVKALNEKETARTAIDLHSGEKVNKTEAYIVLLDNEGAVGYFKNKDNAVLYLDNQK